MAKQYIAATATAANAWTAACEAAEKLRASRFTTEERALIAQGIKPLELAQGGATEAEHQSKMSVRGASSSRVRRMCPATRFPAES